MDRFLVFHISSILPKSGINFMTAFNMCCSALLLQVITSPLKFPRSIQLFCSSVEATFPLAAESTILAPSYERREYH